MTDLWYAILQYVPDPVRDERLNIGVLVAGDEPRFFSARLLPQTGWGRIRRLGYDQDRALLVELRRQFAAETLTGAEIPGAVSSWWTAGRMREASTEWCGTLQVSRPRPVIHDQPAALVNELFKRCVADPGAPRRRPRDRKWVNAKIRVELRAAITTKLPDASFDEYLAQKPRVEGAHEAHAFDFELRNGHSLELMRSLSFETADTMRLRNEVDAIAFAITDLQAGNVPTPVTVVSIGEGRLLQTAERLYGELGANLVREAEIPTWAEASSEKLLLSVGG